MENIYRSLADPAARPTRRASMTMRSDDCVEILSTLRERLRRNYNTIMAIGRSYADFSRLGGDAQTQLQLLAFEPRSP